MNKGKKLYEGKAKIIYDTKDKNLVIQHFKDDATAFNNLKKAKVQARTASFKDDCFFKVSECFDSILSLLLMKDLASSRSFPCGFPKA